MPFPREDMEMYRGDALQHYTMPGELQCVMKGEDMPEACSTSFGIRQGSVPHAGPHTRQQVSRQAMAIAVAGRGMVG